MRWTFGVFVALLLSGCREAGPIAGPVDPEPLTAPSAPLATVAANDLDVSMVAADAVAAIAIFPKRMASRPWFSLLIAEDGLTQVEGWEDLRPLSCEHVVISLAPGTGSSALEWVARADWTDPMDLDSLLADASDHEVEDRNGRRFHRLGKEAIGFYQASPTTIWAGNIDRLQASLEGRLPTGDLAARLSAEPCQGEITLVATSAPVQTLLLESLDGDQALAAGAGSESAMTQVREVLERLRGMTLAIDSTQEKLGVMRVEFDDPRFAERMRDQARKQLAQWKLTLPTLIAFGAGRLPSDVNQSATSLAFSLLASIRFETQESFLEATMVAPPEADQHLSVLFKFASELVEKERRRARLARVAEALKSYRQAKGDLSDLENSLNGSGGLSWRVHLLPFLGEQELYDSFRLEESWDSEHNLALAAKIPEVYRDLTGSEQTSFLGLVGAGMALGATNANETQEPISPGDDAPETTLAVLDTGGKQRVTWTSPEDLRALTSNDLAAWGPQEEGAVAVITADGEVRRLPKAIDPDTLASAVTARGGESIEIERLFPPDMQQRPIRLPFGQGP